MRKSLAAITCALLGGFVLGNLTGQHGIPLWEGDQKAADVAGEAASPAEPTTQASNEQGPLGSVDYPTVAADVQDPVPGHDDPGIPAPDAWSQRYPEAPPLDPPHVAEPYFHGVPTDPEAVRLRAMALEEHIRSLREAGVPEAVIQAALSGFERDFERAREQYQAQKRLAPEQRM